MTPEQQRIAIAEACGWRHIKGKKRWNAPTGGWDYLSSLPNYIDDLNAMNEAVMSLSAMDRIAWRKELQYIIAPDTKPSKVRGIKIMGEKHYDQWFNATAAQRAEAFLRTIGKWVEP